jgi:hypothetical protein
MALDKITKLGRYFLALPISILHFKFLTLNPIAYESFTMRVIMRGMTLLSTKAGMVRFDL